MLMKLKRILALILWLAIMRLLKLDLLHILSDQKTYITGGKEYAETL